ncbi:hypothetical protein MULP_05402 [Mycobacterium liflandii 128FXT]|uniref:Uncharacterized protein n=1 Tax=Mycobacterium liflandii (strain 128FXT) TaxID=459424 RepID=L7VHF1_MYCL1|nr:hypothetical protein MULP_05402 [Mycobacterium liflandii 128FXT]
MRSEVVSGFGVEDLREHRDHACEIRVGARCVTSAVQPFQVSLPPVEARTAFGQQEIEELAGERPLPSRNGWA